MSERGTIEFGFLAAPIGTQLRRQRIKADPKLVEVWERDADAILRLSVRKHITTRAKLSALKSLTREMRKHITIPKPRKSRTPPTPDGAKE